MTAPAVAVRERVGRLFRPRSIAVVGASNTPGKRGHVILSNLAKIGYRGRVFPVHPNYAEVLGHRCWPSLESLPEVPDVVAVCLAAAAVPEIVERCGALGVHAMAVVAAGFADAGPDGAVLEARMLAAAERHGISIMGPNGIGIINRLDRMQYWMSSPAVPAYADTTPSGVSCILASGALGLMVTTDGLERGLALDHVVSAGAQVSLDASDYIDWMLEQGEAPPRAIGAMLEGIVKPEAFRRVARRALAKGTALVVMKSGRSAATRELIASHTGALVGGAEVADRVFAEDGVIAVNDLDEWTEQFVLHAQGRAPRGKRWFMLSPSGGGNAILADLAAGMGMPVPPATAAVTEAMRAIGDRPVLNPFDSGGYYDAKGVATKALQAAIADPEVDAVIGWLSMWPVEGRGHGEIMDAFARLAPQADKPVLMATFTAGPVGDHARQRLNAGGLMPLKGARPVLLALQRWLQWHALRRDGLGGPPVLPPPLAVAAPAGPLDPDVARTWLAEAGLDLATQCEVAEAQDAIAFAAERGTRIVLKLEHALLPHKTEVGAVVTGLADPARITEAVQRMQREVRPAIALQGARLIAQEQLEGGVELLLAARRDPVFGAHVVVGLGGVLAELFRDVTLRPAPVTRETARAMLAELKGAPLLRGYRKGMPHDVEAAAAAIERLSILAARLGPRLDTIELNPLIVLPEGRGAFVADVVASLA